jgi:hypothetical protein
MNIEKLVAAAKKIEELTLKSKAKSQEFLKLAHDSKLGLPGQEDRARRVQELSSTVIVYDDAIARLCAALNER